MKKSLLLLAIICCILVLVPSCRKKSDGSENTSLVQSLISSESTSNLEPVVVVPQPQSAEKRAEDSTVSVVTPSAEPKEEKAETTLTEVVVETPSAVVVPASPVETAETAVETVSAPLSTVETEAEEKAEESLEIVEEKETKREDVIYYSFPYSYGGYSSDIVIADTYTSLIIPEGVSDEDIAAVAALICEKYPAEASLITYTISDGTLTLYYPEQTRDYIDSIITFVEAEAKALLDMYPVPQEEVSAVETAPEKTEESAPAVEEKTEAVSLETPSLTVVEEKALAEKTAFIKNWSIAGYAEPKFNLTSDWASPFVVGFGVRGEASFSDRLAAGLKLQYDMSSYIETSIYLRWTFLEADKFDFYLRSGVGASFGIGGNKGQIAFLADAALGLSYNFNSSLSLFAEITGEWSIPKPGLELGGAVGVKYTF